MQAKKLMGIDPGLSGTGYAVFSSVKDAPLSIGVITGKGNSWEKRAISIGETLSDVAGNAGVSEIWIELPQYYESDKGVMVAEKGDLIKLTVTVGVIIGILSQDGIEVKAVTPNEWKGQLSKELAKRRILKRLGEEACSSIKSHAWDATGIGLYAKGNF